jgi:2-methylcitrate dehydratase PrpD
VTAIHCRVSKFCFDAACLAEPRDGLEGKFSTYYCAAIALIEGKAGEDLFNSEKTKDPTIREVMRLVSIEENQALSDHEADVLIKLGDGRSLHHNVTSPKGSPDHPLTNDDVEDKFRNIIKPIFAQKSADHILEKLWNVENIVKVGEIPALLAVSGQP